MDVIELIEELKKYEGNKEVCITVILHDYAECCEFSELSIKEVKQNEKDSDPILLICYA